MCSQLLGFGFTNSVVRYTPLQVTLRSFPPSSTAFRRDKNTPLVVTNEVFFHSEGCSKGQHCQVPSRV